MPLRNINHYASSYNIIISYSILPVIKSFYPGLTQNQIDKELIKLTKTILKTIIKYEPIKTIKKLHFWIKLGGGWEPPLAGRPCVKNRRLLS